MRLADLIACVDAKDNTNVAMVDRLKRERTLLNDRNAMAMIAVDRGDYIDPDRTELTYSDMPLKVGNVHLSAPSIYASALEALDVQPGMSFLHLGSGTGYFSTIVAQLAGEFTVNHGVEHREELVQRARQQAEERGYAHMEFFHANAFQMDVANSMRYDRIYIAAALAEDKRLFGLLRLGGVLVAPFDSGTGDEFFNGPQHLAKVTRLGWTKYLVEKLQPVQFAPLQHPGAQALSELPPLALQPPTWSPEVHTRFPREFKRVVLLLLWANTQVDSPLALVPKELILRIVAFTDFFAFKTSLSPEKLAGGLAVRRPPRAHQAVDRTSCGGGGPFLGRKPTHAKGGVARRRPRPYRLPPRAAGGPSPRRRARSYRTWTTRSRAAPDDQGTHVSRPRERIVEGHANRLGRGERPGPAPCKPP